MAGSSASSLSGPDARPRGVHLVGSVPLADSEAVFREVWAKLGDRLRRVPDGETGIRTNWIQWQFPLLLEVPEFESADERAGPFGARLQLRSSVRNNEISFPELGYRAAASESYEVFARLKDEGVIGQDVRFQVCLPTPLAVIHVRFIPRDQEAVELAYERQMLEELGGVIEAVPAEELAIQWDTAVEFAILEGVLESFLDDPLTRLLSGSFGSAIMSRPGSRWAITFATATRITSISSSRPILRNSLPLPIGSAPGSTGRSTGCTCRSLGTAATTSISLRSASWSCRRALSVISGWFT